MREWVAKAWSIVRATGPLTLLAVLLDKCGVRLPEGSRWRWRAGTNSEIAYWDGYLRTRGRGRAAEFEQCLDPDLLLQARPAALLPDRAEIAILDVGAGPMTRLGKRFAERKLSILAVDPLALAYDRLLERHGLNPPVRTLPLAGEQLTSRFAPESFDLVYARNCLDHMHDPLRVLHEMLAVSKPGCCVLLEHYVDEASHNAFQGLHQWDLSTSADGHFLLASRDVEIDVTRELAGLAEVGCEVLSEPRAFLIVRLRKLGSEAQGDEVGAARPAATSSSESSRGTPSRK